VLTAYIDESWDDLTMCVGGWLCDQRTWRLIEYRWNREIERENKLSGRLGLQSLSRYHAADLHARRSEYKGWTEDRGVRFTKRLIDILGKPKSQPIGIACGVSFADMLAASPEWDRHHPRHKWELAAYRMCMLSCLRLVLDTMSKEYPDENVTVIHDRGKFNGAAQSAFDAIKQSRKLSNIDSLLTVTPLSWKDCTALQPADMMVFEGRKLVKNNPGNVESFRRSLQRMIGRGIKLRVWNIPQEGLKETIDKHLKALDEEANNPGA